MSGIEVATGELINDAKPEPRQVPREALCYEQDIINDPIYHIKNLIEATSGQARITGKESIRVRMARKRAEEFIAYRGL